MSNGTYCERRDGFQKCLGIERVGAEKIVDKGSAVAVSVGDVVLNSLKPPV